MQDTEYTPAANTLNGKTYIDNRPIIQVILELENDCTMQESVNMNPNYADDLPFGILDPKTTSQRTVHDFVQSAVKLIKYELCIRHRLNKKQMDEIELDLVVEEMDVPQEIIKHLGLEGEFKTLIIQGESFGYDTENIWMVTPQIIEGMHMTYGDCRKKFGCELGDVTDF